MRENYSDFQLTLENCDREPIHRPEAIEATGHLLAFKDDDTGALLARSEGAAEYFGADAEQLEKIGLQALPADVLEHLEKFSESGLNLTISSGAVRSDGKNLTVICHRHKDVLFLEQELGDAMSIVPQDKVSFRTTILQISDVDTLCDYAASFFRTQFGFDRVMVYKFDVDHHGFIIGEAKREDMEPFLGLHYPATDIPEQARQLFLANRSRAIPDVDLKPRRLLINSKHSGHLDLSLCQLRATSSIHIEYLKNMGVRATMTLAIIVNGKLWGLFAFHHNSAINPEYMARSQAELISSLFAQRLTEIEAHDLAVAQKQSKEKTDAFVEELRIENQFQLRVLRKETPLRELCPCDGAAVVTSLQEPFTLGIVPEQNALSALRDWLVSEQTEPIYATDNIAAVWPEDAPSLGEIGGVLAVRVSELTDTFVIWFRRCQQFEITWAGDPRLPQVIKKVSADGITRLSPRQSFEKWLDQVSDRSFEWEAWVLRMAEDVRRRILSLELKYNAELVARASDEFMQLTFAASHDLQEPLRTQLSYLDIIREELGEVENEELLFCLNGAEQATHRMQALVRDMLDYSELGREQTWELVSLEDVMSELHADYSDMLERSGGRLIWNTLPSMFGDRRHLRSIIQNLVSNALKYVAPDVNPVVEVSIRRGDRHFDLCISDNGIGIKPENRERIFSMFTRLHRREEYKGTGIGLTIARRAINMMGGSIGVESKPGGGSVFWCRFHEAQLEEQ